MTQTIAQLPQRRTVPDIQARLALVVTLVLLALIAAQRYLTSKPSADATAYHAAVRVEADGFPYHFGDWLGVDAPVPQAAVTMLKPNFIISRRYQNLVTGHVLNFLVVHCEDARDILGHYPPVCYPNQGWRVDSALPHDWPTGDATVSGTRYAFTNSLSGSGAKLLIDNFMVLPTGSTGRGMDEVELVARDGSLKHFGAAQVQLVYLTPVTDSDRDRIFAEFFEQFSGIASAIKHPERIASNP
jgi:hypothetical protein